jgi:anti-sigma factor RsiW
MAFFEQQDACNRARYWISLGLDSELSEFESQAARSHLGRCHECREFERHLLSVTTMLREQPLVRLDRPVTLPRRRSRVVGTRFVRQAGFVSAAAATVVVAVGAFLSVSSSNHGPRTESVRARADSPPADRNDVRTLQRQVVQRSVASRPEYAHSYSQRSWIEDL